MQHCEQSTRETIKQCEKTIAEQLISSLESVLAHCETVYHLDLLVRDKPKLYYELPYIICQEVGDHLKSFFIHRYPSLFKHRRDRECLKVFDDTAKFYKDESILEFHDEMIKTIKRFFDFNISLIVDRYWPKIETAMNQAQKYFSGLETHIYTVNKGSVYITYFTRNGKIINDEFNPYTMIDTYRLIDELYTNTIWNDYNGLGYGKTLNPTDDWYTGLEKLLPEDENSKCVQYYTIPQHCTECRYNEIMNVFKYFDRDNQIKIREIGYKYDETIANQIIDDLKKVILDFETKHHLDLIVKFDPDWWCYDSDMSYRDVGELLKEFFENHYPSLIRYELDKNCLNVFDQAVDECEDKDMKELHDKLIETTKKFLDDNVAPLVDSYWPKIEKAMAEIQKYFPGLEINTYSVGWDKNEVNITYFTKNGILVSDEFDPRDLFEAYHIVDDLCGKLIFIDDCCHCDILHCTDGYYDGLEELIPEDLREDVYVGNYVLTQHHSECFYEAVTNVFKYFDKNNDIKIKDGW